MQAEDSRQWRFVDLFKAPGLAFDFSRIGVGFFTVFGCMIVIGLGRWLRSTLPGPFLAGLIFWVAVALVALIGSIGAVIIARQVRSELLDDRKLDMKEGRRWVQRKLGTVIGTPLAFVAIIAFFMGWVLLGTWLCDLTGSLGNLFYGLLFGLTFLAGLIAAIFALVLVFGGLFFPGVLAVHQGIWVDVLGELFPLCTKKLLKLILHLAVILAQGAVLTAIVGGVLWVALQACYRPAERLMDDRVSVAEKKALLAEPVGQDAMGRLSAADQQQQWADYCRARALPLDSELNREVLVPFIGERVMAAPNFDLEAAWNERREGLEGADRLAYFSSMVSNIPWCIHSTIPTPLLPRAAQAIERPADQDGSGWDSICAIFFGLTLMLITALAGGIIFAYLFAATTISYLLLRDSDFEIPDLDEEELEAPAGEGADSPLEPADGDAGGKPADAGEEEEKKEDSKKKSRSTKRKTRKTEH